MTSILDINSTIFTIFNYPMSYIEFFGTILNLWCVWLTTKARVLSWPVGLLGSILYVFLFYQIQLYSDLFEQIYFIITGIAGWYAWVRYNQETDNTSDTVDVDINGSYDNYKYLAIIVLGTGILSYITINLTFWLPTLFPEPVSFPILDALTTVMSFVAQWLLIRKKIESWILWIAVDLIGIWLYWVKGVKFISLEYVIFLIMASYGLYNWIKIHSDKKNAQKTSIAI